MEDLQTGDILTRISDNTKWQFLHYGEKARDMGFSTTLANEEGTLHFLDDKTKIHVKEWDKTKNQWVADSHEEFPTEEFKKA
jgi:hypothetical protein